MPVNHALCNSKFPENSILSLGSRVQSISYRCIHLPGGRMQSIPPCRVTCCAPEWLYGIFRGEVKIFHSRKNPSPLPSFGVLFIERTSPPSQRPSTDIVVMDFPQLDVLFVERTSSPSQHPSTGIVVMDPHSSSGVLFIERTSFHHSIHRQALS